MAYAYATEREQLFTDEGQRMFLSIRDHTHKLLKQSGAVTMEKAINCVGGSAWTMLACVERLVELGEIKEIDTGREKATQDRVFIRVRR